MAVSGNSRLSGRHCKVKFELLQGDCYAKVEDSRPASGRCEGSLIAMPGPFFGGGLTWGSKPNWTGKKKKPLKNQRLFKFWWRRRPCGAAHHKPLRSLQAAQIREAKDSTQVLSFVHTHPTSVPDADSIAAVIRNHIKNATARVAFSYVMVVGSPLVSTSVRKA